jgi:S1-C subfamily serine protease
MAATRYQAPARRQWPSRAAGRWSNLLAPIGWTTLLCVALLVSGCAVTAAPAPQGEGSASAASPFDDDADALALKRASDATVGLLTHALEGARSARTLGTHRIGSGVVIGADGLVLTIGYLILEADQIDLELDNGRHIPARAVGYDQATGFGLVQALAPLGIEPVPFGRAATVTPDDALLVVSGVRAGQAGLLSPARLALRRAFAGYWEYHIDAALFTTPARRDHSGAGLFNRHGELIGIGSLLLADVAAEGDATPAEHRQPGNMFVPVDLLAPVLGELRASGSTRASRRAWLGLNCQIRDGRLVVLRVTDDGPAEAAGVLPGDVITALDGAPVRDLADFYRRLWGEGPAERLVKLDLEHPGGGRQQVEVSSVDRRSTIRQLQGI